MLLLQLREEARQGQPEGLRHLQGRDDGDGHLPPLDLPHVGTVYFGRLGEPGYPVIARSKKAMPTPA